MRHEEHLGPLVHFLKAIEIDFQDVLEKKNARASVQQIIRELEMTQHSIYSPIIVNGRGFGLLANHSFGNGVLYQSGQCSYY